MAIDQNNPFILASRKIAQHNGTEQILLLLLTPLIDFAQRIGCTRIGSSGETPRGIPFRLKGRSYDLFSFWVERLDVPGPDRQGLAAIAFDPERLHEELRSDFLSLMAQLQRKSGYRLAKNGNYDVQAVSFTTAAEGLQVLAAIDNFISAAVERLGIAAFPTPEINIRRTQQYR